MVIVDKFEGKATIRIIFKCRAEYLKFRKYVLKTEWQPCTLDCPPYEELIMPFSCSDDIDAINRRIISLLQMGFNVYCCQFFLDNITDQFAEDFIGLEERDNFSIFDTCGEVSINGEGEQDTD